MNVSTLYRHMSCKKLVKLPSAKENRQSILKRALEYMTGFLCEGKSQEEILHRIAEFLTKSYENEWFTFYWQKECAISNDMLCMERFLKWIPEDCIMMASSVNASVKLKMKLPDQSNILQTSVSLILQTKDGKYHALLLYFKKPDKSLCGKNVHTSIASDLYVMTAKAGLEYKYPNIIISSVYLRNADDVDGKLLPELKVCNNKKSNVFSVDFEGFYEDRVFQNESFRSVIEKIISQPMKPPCTWCEQKTLCSISQEDADYSGNDVKESGEYILPEFTSAQQKVVSFKEGSMLVCAGPGSGKTATLTGRVNQLIKQGAPAETILVITFTNEAANELKKRCRCFCKSVLPKISTINALGFEILKSNKNIIGKVNLLDNAEQHGIVKSLLAAFPPLCGINYAVEYGKYGLYKTVCRKLNQYRNCVSREEFFLKESILGSDFIQFAELYEQILRERGLITFDEQISLCNKLFNEYPEILSIYQNIYRYIMVDEAQDLNREQTEFIYKIAEHGNIMLVGDDDQSIYGFRGASNQYMLQFPKIFPNTETVVLNDNFRSTKQIVIASQNLIQKNRMRIQKQLCCNRKDGIAPILMTGTDVKSICGIVKICLENGYLYKDIAIISTKNAPLEALHAGLSMPNILAKSYLREDSLFLVLFDILELYRNPDSEYILLHYLLMQGVKDGMDNPDFLMSVKKNYPDFFSYSSYQKESDDPIYRAFRLLSNSFFMIKHQITSQQLVTILAYHMGITQKASFTALLELIETKQLFDIFKLHEYMHYMIDFEDERRVSQINMNCVLLITSHESKGMEFPVVIMLNDYKECDEETRRLFYVAMTRAKDYLYILSENECGTRFLEEMKS